MLLAGWLHCHARAQAQSTHEPSAHAPSTQAPSTAVTGAARSGHLLIVGGGLRPENQPVFEKLIELAGGRAHARFAILPTASINIGDSHEFVKRLELYGIAPEQTDVLDVMEANARVATADPKILEKVRAATCVFLAGGDQRRLVRLLTTSDGGDTPLLSEIRNVLARGGLIAGSSAGASAQSRTLLAVSGLPDMLIDEGLDALDFGITTHTCQRGLLITRGLGFFDQGIIDQHFYQFRGRLGRLVRATSDCGEPFGFGIDENTAIVVAPSGRLTVVGAGFLTIVQPGAERGQDGPMGYQISDVKLSLLSNGDEFDPSTQQIVIAAEKSPLTPDKVEYNGNFLLTDIGAGGQGIFALVNGLAENRRPVQEAVSLKFHGDTTHGYRFRFSKRPTTQAYAGIINRLWAYSLLDVRLDILPIADGLKPAETQLPRDLPEGPERGALAAIAFRGLLPANDSREFRPQAPISRGEFALALARSTHLTAAAENVSPLSDVDTQTLEGDEILRVVAAGLMHADEQHAFHPDQQLEPVEASSALVQLAHLAQPTVEPELTADIQSLAQAAPEQITRARIGLLLHRILKLPK
jgi:cyanophycinase